MKTQKELKEIYKQILENEVWGNSQLMINFCLRKTAYIVELENGDIIALDKPTIQKDFCFGYSDSRYNTEDFDRVETMVEVAKTSESYFIEENLAGINKIIEEFENPHPFEHFIGTQYTGRPKDSRLKCICTFYWYDERKNNYTPLSDKDRQAIIDGYKIVKEQFEKRLHTYFKKYGLSKINAWSYWRDI